MAPTDPQASGELMFIGTATTLLRFGAFAVLTDPNFLRRGQRAYLGYGVASKRLTEPALRVDELPALDAVVLSHLHGDHFDRVAKRGLDHDVPLVTTPHGSRRLQLQGFRRAIGLRTWTEQAIHRDGRTVRVTAVPGLHARGPLQALLPPVMGSLVDFLDTSGRLELRVYLSGDTLMFRGVHEVPRRYPDIDLVVVHLGGTRLPAGERLPGLMVTMDGREGVEFLRAVSARTAVPVHYDDYGVFTSGLGDFQRAVAAAGFDGIVRTVTRGESLSLSARES